MRRVCLAAQVLVWPVGAALGQSTPTPSSTKPTAPLCQECRFELSAPISILATLRRDPEIGAISGIAIHERKWLYVSDLPNTRVLRLPLGGGEWSAFGRRGEGPGEFTVPQQLATTANGDIIAYDPAQTRLSHFGPTGALRVASRLPFPITYVKGLLADGNHAYISGVSSSGPASQHILHKVSLQGEHVRSFGAPSADLPAGFERLIADAGPLVWGPERKSIWLSRGGPTLQLLQFSTRGDLIRSISVPTPLVPEWTSRMTVSASGGTVSISSRPLLGTVALLSVADTLLLNIAALDDSLRIRYDVFHARSGAWLASWESVRSSPGTILVLGDGANTVFEVNPRESVAITSYRFKLTSP